MMRALAISVLAVGVILGGSAAAVASPSSMGSGGGMVAAHSAVGANGSLSL